MAIPAPVTRAVRAVRTDIVAPPEPRRRPRTGHILPLRLAQQAIRLPRLTRQPRRIRLRVVPTHAHHRVHIRLRKTRRTPRTARILLPLIVLPFPAPPYRTPRRLHETRELTARNLVDAHRELRADRHPALRTLVAIAPFLRRRRTHRETPRRDHNHLRATIAVAENLPHREILRRLVTQTPRIVPVAARRERPQILLERRRRVRATRRSERRVVLLPARRGQRVRLVARQIPRLLQPAALLPPPPSPAGRRSHRPRRKARPEDDA